MSAIGFSDKESVFNDKAVLIGAHADFRFNDYFFLRTQSPSLSSAEWESRIKPMHSWSEFIVYGAGIALAVLAMAVFV